MAHDIDMRVLLDLNTRTIADGAAADTELVARALGLSASQLRDSLNRLQQQRLVTLESVDLVGLTTLGSARADRVGGRTSETLRTDGEIFYTSQNGDSWVLSADTEGRRFVRHVANKSSGGAVELTDLQSFLDREPHSPQNQALNRVLN
jgi:hypothetical protein